MPESCCPPSIQACKTRTILTLPQVIQIKSSHLYSKTLGSKGLTAAAVGISFGVSEKAIRDIWRGRTWVRETMHLDPASYATTVQMLRLPGRPKRHATKAVSDRNRNMANQSTSNTSEYVASSAASVNPESIQHMARVVASLLPPESLYVDDPFHDDWPHWEAAREWAQRAAADGYCT
jgi:hypothetical protein